MKRPIFICFLVFLAIVFIVVGMRAEREVSIDSCLDRGGRWNGEAAVCEGATE